MDYFDEESRPRFLFQTRTSASAATPPAEPDSLIKTSKLTAALCLASSSLLLFFAFYFFLSFQIVNFLLVWISLSLLVGPFAPLSLTGGDIRVGRGEILEEPSDPDPAPDEGEEQRKRNPGRRSRQYRSDAPLPSTEYSASLAAVGYVKAEKTEKRNADPIPARDGQGGGGGEVGEREWNDEDFEILKKQIAKHPVGTPRRWELIAEAFKGRHGVESVIKTAKSLSEKRPGTGDSFTQFLRQRKPLEKRVEGVNADSPDGILLENCDVNGNAADGSTSWTSGEDRALLSALKAFPKDVPLRWEKIAAAVPGKPKACCMKRVAELKKEFRSSKASEL